MPNRIVKAGLKQSEQLAEISYGAEMLFVRLILTVDDFGGFKADIRIVLAECMGARVLSVNQEEIAGWLGELSKVGLIVIYRKKGVLYLTLPKFTEHNKPRSKTPKFPSVDNDCEIICDQMITCEHLRSNVSNCDQMLADVSNCDHLHSFDSKRIHGRLTPNTNTHTKTNSKTDSCDPPDSPPPSASASSQYSVSMDAHNVCNTLKSSILEYDPHNEVAALSIEQWSTLVRTDWGPQLERVQRAGRPWAELSRAARILPESYWKKHVFTARDFVNKLPRILAAAADSKPPAGRVNNVPGLMVVSEEIEKHHERLNKIRQAQIEERQKELRRKKQLKKEQNHSPQPPAVSGDDMPDDVY